jgi:ubiquinone biosynthesis protein Coq4
MRRYGLKLDFIGEFEGKDILSYLWCRAGHVHDIAHMILGYDISFLGEAAVKGFELAQYLSPATAAILGGGLLSVSSLQPEALGPMLEITFEGYRAGKLYPLLVGLKWDLEWETPLRDLMIKFNLPQRRAVEGGQMLWST